MNRIRALHRRPVLGVVVALLGSASTLAIGGTDFSGGNAENDLGTGGNTLLTQAGSITANYDGYRKNRTTIGSRVKTSVDTPLVAPVTVGDDAFTAAGSVIGQDVPPGALAGSPGVARAAQRTVEGYSERRRERAEERPRESAEVDAQDPRR